MGITYHPEVGEALWCDYSGIEPEMVKRRLAIVVSPRAAQRSKLVTVVAVSTTAPDPVRAWHFRLERDPYPEGDKSEVWVKCDMINVVCFDRLWGYHRRWNGRRQYRKMKISLDDLRGVRSGILCALGLNGSADGT